MAKHVAIGMQVIDLQRVSDKEGQKLMRIQAVFTFLCLLASNPALACAEWLNNFPEAPYAQMRLAIIEDGWEPIPGPPAEVSHDPALTWRDQYGWIEAITCAPTGASPCAFAFQRGGQRLVIGTIGEGWAAWVDGWRCETASPLNR